MEERTIVRSKFPYFAWLLAAAALSLTAAGCSKKPESSEPAVQVNRYEMSAAEFNEQFLDFSPTDSPAERERFLNNLITRKLLLQEAKHLGLDTDKEFLKTVEGFWEQSLLKLVVSQKMKSVAGSMQATPAEIEAGYRKWQNENPGSEKPLSEIRDMMAWRVQREKESRALEDWTGALHSDAKIHVDRKAVGLE